MTLSLSLHSKFAIYRCHQLLGNPTIRAQRQLPSVRKIRHHLNEHFLTTSPFQSCQMLPSECKHVVCPLPTDRSQLHVLLLLGDEQDEPAEISDKYRSCEMAFKV